MEKILILVKTKLSEDTRVLNQLEIIASNFSDAQITILNLPNYGDECDFDLPKNVTVELIKTPFRGIRILRIVNAIWFWFASFLKVIQLKPKLIHCHDSATVPIAFLLNYLPLKKRPLIIYDDHELDNNYPNIKLQTWLEERVLNNSDLVIFPNRLRMEFLHSERRVSPQNYLIFQNICPIHSVLPKNGRTLEAVEDVCGSIKVAREKFKRVIIHQGVTNKFRRFDLLCSIIEKYVEFLFVILAPSAKHKSVLKKYSNVLIVNPIPSAHLDFIWKLADYSLIFYESESLNNNLCAPNRFFLTFKNNVNFIYNTENLALTDLDNTFGGGTGICFESLDKILNIKDNSFKEDYSKFEADQINIFAEQYKKILQRTR